MLKLPALFWLATAAAAASIASADDALPPANAGRLERRIHELGRFGANPEGGVSRVAFSKADIAGRAYVKSLMLGAGLEVRVDTAGNIIGHRAGTDPELPVIMTGSHIDSVPQGGNYDGDVGVARRHRGGGTPARRRLDDAPSARVRGFHR